MTMNDKILVCKVNEKSVKCTDGNVVITMGKQGQAEFMRVTNQQGTGLYGKFKCSKCKDPIKTLTAQQIIDMV